MLRCGEDGLYGVRAGGLRHFIGIGAVVRVLDLIEDRHIVDAVGFAYELGRLGQFAIDPALHSHRANALRLFDRDLVFQQD